MNELIHQRCTIHWRREAAARCPECGRYFCRECITEHEGRVLCAGCLRKIMIPAIKRKRHPFRFLFQFGQLLLGILLLWLFFYYVGSILQAIPTSFHDGTLWKP